jgi:hypothetical protein
MEFTITAAKMQSLMEQSIKNAESGDYTFACPKRDKEILDTIKVMESMSVRHIEVDLSADDLQ